MLGNKPKATAPPIVLERAATLTKQELAVSFAHYGAGNSVRFEGKDASTLYLFTFKGSWEPKSKKFVGEYQFAAGGSWMAGEVDRITDFNRLPGIALQRSQKAVKAAPATVVETPNVADI